MTSPQFTTPTEQAEEWRPVVGYEGLYEVSSFGRVRSARTLHILKPHPNHNGYLRVGLSNNGKHVTRRVHVLVAAAFLGPCPVGKEVNHIDFDRSNARATNLEYLTRLDNIIHSVKGKRVSAQKLTEADVLAIRASTESRSVVAARYGIAKATVQNIIARKRWHHVA